MYSCITYNRILRDNIFDIINMTMAQNNNTGRSILRELTSITLILAYITVVLNISATSWYAGYLEYFNVPINDIDFSPKIFDFATKGLGAMILIFISCAIMILLLFGLRVLTDAIQKKALKSRHKWIKNFFAGGGAFIPKWMLVSFSICIILVGTYNVCYRKFSEMGSNAAKETKIFSVIEDDDEVYEVMIYQNNNTGIIKTYDKESKSFNDGFEITMLEGHSMQYTQVTD